MPTAKESNNSSDHLRSPLHLRPAIQSARLSATGGLVIGGSSGFVAAQSPKKKSPKNVRLAKKKEAEFRKEVMARMNSSTQEFVDKPFAVGV